MFNNNRTSCVEQHNRNNRTPGRMVLLSLTLAVGVLLMACQSDNQTNSAEESPGQPSPGDSSGSGQDEEPGGNFFPLNIVIDPLRERYCTWETLPVKVIVFNYEEAIIEAQTAALERSVGKDTEYILKMFWGIELRGDGMRGTITAPKPDHTEEFQLSGLSGEVMIGVSVEIVIEEVDGPDLAIVASGKDETTIHVENCPYEMTLRYEGEFSDGVWTYTETASMEKVRLEASPEGAYAGSGALAVAVSQTGNPGGGECSSLEPFQGTSTVEITGGFDEEGERCLHSISGSSPAQEEAQR